MRIYNPFRGDDPATTNARLRSIYRRTSPNQQIAKLKAQEIQGVDDAIEAIEDRLQTQEDDLTFGGRWTTDHDQQLMNAQQSGDIQTQKTLEELAENYSNQYKNEIGITRNDFSDHSQESIDAAILILAFELKIKVREYKNGTIWWVTEIPPTKRRPGKKRSELTIWLSKLPLNKEVFIKQENAMKARYLVHAHGALRKSGLYYITQADRYGGMFITRVAGLNEIKENKKKRMENARKSRDVD